MAGASGEPSAEQVREVMTRLDAIHAKYAARWVDLRRRQLDLLRRVSEQLDRQNLERARKSFDDIVATEQ